MPFNSGVIFHSRMVMRYKKLLALIPVTSLLFNVAIIFAVADVFTIISNYLQTTSIAQIIAGIPQLLIIIVIMLCPWALAIKMSFSPSKKSGFDGPTPCGFSRINVS